jgi:hypothetical protein
MDQVQRQVTAALGRLFVTIIETDDGLWDLVLARVEEILEAHASQATGSGRGPGLWGVPNPQRNVTTHLTVYLADGEVLLYVITARGPSKLIGTKKPTVEVERYFKSQSSDAYWDQQVDAEPAKRVVVDGTHYRLGPDRKSGAKDMKGFAGRRWEIEYLDGRPSVATNDLWYQGKIPEKYRPLLPDNARFI